jgi:hypothetical protein
MVNGIARWILFALDAEGRIRWHCVSPSNVNPVADFILSALESLQN